MNRKTFIKITGLSTAGLLLSSLSYAKRPDKIKIKAVAFDAFPIFDPRPIFKTINDLYPEKGKQLIEIWLTKQFGYQWLRQAGHQYKNFEEVTKDALEFAFAQCKIEADKQTTDLIMAKYNSLTIWDDVVLSLEQLKQQELKICFLSNMTESLLQQGVQNSGIEKYFDYIISTDKKQTYKPSPTAYEMGVEELKLKKEEILFVPFAGWDMAGAKWFGYPTFWVNRLNAIADKLDVIPDGVGNNLAELVALVREYNK